MRVQHAAPVSAHGLLLAAGAGRRMGGPKALVDDWLVRGVRTLRAGGCGQVTVVLGAGAGQARSLLQGEEAEAVVAADWASGMGASLRTGLGALAGSTAEAAVVMLVDLPDVTAAVVGAVLARVTSPADAARATYDGRPGHPVVLGRDHWGPAARSAEGDRGARAYLAGLDRLVLVECAGLASGRDVDTPHGGPDPVAPTPDQRGDE